MFREIFEQVVSATNGQSRVFMPSRVQRKLLSGQVFGSGLAKYLQKDEEKQMGQELIRIGMKTSC